MNRTLPTSGEVHVWFGDSHHAPHADAVGDISLLSREEKIRCARITHLAERRGFAAARAGARRILADLLGAAPETIDLASPPPPLALDLVWSAHGWLFALARDARIAVALAQVEDPASEVAARARVRRKALARIAEAESGTAPQRSSGNFSVHDVPTPGAAIAAVACSGRHRRTGPVSLLLREVPVVT
ncbi:hypothetical protein [Streptomyces hiroshimensis]|uniref:Uncharacterized protein n=1 Tax=Streptomyces hiroshimensis TaxID=66424 RepID=A0ABQ2YRE7_9ACTN|nr:hypothetical protein [Streptomyces hiroshimensis]GGX91940.1 hypothetical protein GCM10010324_42090 [Streptomyces hiroshimensis]